MSLVSRTVAPSSASTPLVRMSGIAKTFPNGTTALSRLDLDVHAGEFLSLIGPSGCGKSTVLRLLAGLTEPSSGTIRWSGTRPEIGFVFQEPTLMPWATVEANVWLPLRLRKVGKAAAAQRIAEALALVGLTAFAESYPRELSGGMKMRASIARALVSRPKLLLMDEPFAALDEITRFKLNNDLLRLRTEIDTTVVFVTHSVYESVYLSDRITVMAARPGRAVADVLVEGPPARDEAFRSTAQYLETCRRTSEALQDAMASERAM